MMIQSLNLSALLSGLEGGSSIQPGLLAEGGNNMAFAADLLQQLALLQGNPAQNANVDAGILSDLQAKAGALDGHAVGQEMQNFAALFGKILPTAKKVGQDIDLDDTLNALADVLQHLQGLETDSPAPAQDLPPAVVGIKPAAQMLPIDTPAQADEQVDPAALAAAVASAMQQQAVPPAQPQLAAEPASAEAPIVAASNDTLLAVKKTMQAGNANGNSDALAAVPAAGDKPAVLPPGGELSGGLSNPNNSSQNAGQDSLPSSDSADSALEELANQVKNVESDKGPSRIAADIAQLNHAVGTEKTAAVPAMARHLGHPEWNQELGEKLIWMHKQDIPSAELRLNPQHLGPISIKIDVNQDQTTVAFTAHNGAVKEAIEAALPKLREMLGGQQLNLADVNVSQQQSEQRQPRDFFQTPNGQNSHSGQDDEAVTQANQAGADIVEEIEAGRAIASNGLLSLFA